MVVRHGVGERPARMDRHTGTMRSTGDIRADDPPQGTVSNDSIAERNSGMAARRAAA